MDAAKRYAVAWMDARSDGWQITTSRTQVPEYRPHPDDYDAYTHEVVSRVEFLFDARAATSLMMHHAFSLSRGGVLRPSDAVPGGITFGLFAGGDTRGQRLMPFECWAVTRKLNTVFFEGWGDRVEFVDAYFDEEAARVSAVEQTMHAAVQRPPMTFDVELWTIPERWKEGARALPTG